MNGKCEREKQNRRRRRWEQDGKIEGSTRLGKNLTKP